MRIYSLNKKVLHVKNNAEKFLFGLTTNTLDRPLNAFVNIHGRIVATFEQLKTGNDEFILLVEEPFVGPLLSHVARYLPLSQTQITTMNDYRTFWDLDSHGLIGEKDFVISHNHGRILVSQDAKEAKVSTEEFTRFRLDHQIPTQGIDYKDDFILNVDETDYVSFTKGCFLGQEPVAKVHNRSKPTWKLLVRYEDECDDEGKAKMTSKVKEKDGRVRGFVFVKNV